MSKVSTRTAREEITTDHRPDIDAILEVDIDGELQRVTEAPQAPADRTAGIRAGEEEANERMSDGERTEIADRATGPIQKPDPRPNKGRRANRIAEGRSPKAGASATTGVRAVRLDEIRLDEIRIDGDTQPRDGIDAEAVAEYAERIGAGDSFPPMEVIHDGRHYWLWDGFHRYHAAEKLGKEEASVNVIEGTVQDARWRSLAANKMHGLKRGNKDKRRAVELAVKHRPDLSDNAIADHVGVDHKTVSAVRREATWENPKSDTRTGKDGRTIDTRKIGGKKPAPVLDSVIPPGGHMPIPDTDAEEEPECVPAPDPSPSPIHVDILAAEAVETPVAAEVRESPLSAMRAELNSVAESLDEADLRRVLDFAENLSAKSGVQ